jgi:imidazolonepropionase-like amidohydrolase
MNGFTTVRDMGGMGTGFTRAIEKGYVESPRIYSAGAHVTQTGGHADSQLRGQPNLLVSGT